MLKNLTIYQDLARDQAPQWKKGQKTGWSRKNGGGLVRGNELHYPFPSSNYRSPIFVFWRMPIFFSFSPNAEPVPRLMKIIAELSCARSARSGERWVRNFGPEKIVLSPPGWNFAFQAPARFSGKSHGHPVHRTFRGEKITTTKPSLSFD